MESKTVMSAVIGLAVGDALGVPVEFKTRAELDNNPVCEMTGYGTYAVPAGSWSDDTSMTLCALDAFAQRDTSLERVMDNFVKWYHKGEYTPTGVSFDIGNTCYSAIDNYFNYHMDIDHCGLDGEENNGNGSLMRIIPFALLYSDELMPLDERLESVYRASALTHAHKRSKIACGIYCFIVWELLKAQSKQSVVRGLHNAYRYYRWRMDDSDSMAYNRLFERIGMINPCDNGEDLSPLNRTEIKSSGYVVDTIEAAIWSVMNTHSYEECVLTAVNLGSDTDTVGAVAGGLAGLIYGYDSIPGKWMNTLKKREYIEELCEKASVVMP